MHKKPKQIFSFLFDWEIWKIVFDSDLPLLAVETRDSISKKIKITVINSETAVIVDEGELTENWWSTLAGLKNGKIIIQFFKDSKIPEPKGFICYDSNTRSIVHQNPNGSFGFFTGNQIISTKVFFEKIVYESYDLNTSKQSELIGSDLINLSPTKINILLPQQYPEENTHFNTIKRFINRCTNKEAIKAVDYSELELFIAVSYYIRATKKLDNYLLVTDREGTVLLDTLIASDLETVSQDPFFVKDNQLYFVKNKKEFQSYEF